ncbi:MAG: hypothetical protein HYZ84_07470 [Candidatus Omnitrophica bacterium]|nr:hypothetical protein [Candidatus Omnitrophota bacterium]
METSKTTFAFKQSAIQVSNRDLEIFRFVQSGSAKTSGEIEKKFWNEKSREAHAGFQRIRKLIETGYLERGNPKLLYVTTKAQELMNQASSRVEEVRNVA